MAEQPEEVSKEVPKGSEEVLIEIDGKFELVTAADMQAKQPTDPPTPRLQQQAKASGTEDPAAIKNSENKHIKLEKRHESTEAENYDDDDFEDDDASHSSASSSPSVDHIETATPSDHKEKDEMEQSSTPKSSVDPVSTEPPSNVVGESITADLVEEKNTTAPVESPSNNSSALIEAQNNNSAPIQDQSKTDDASESGTHATQNHSNTEPVIKLPPRTKDSKSILGTSAESVSVKDSNISVKHQGSSVEIIVSEHGVQAATDSAYTNKSSNERSRTKSAPSRSTIISQYWEDDEAERRQRSENAFKAWLSKKDAQIAEERRLQRANTRMMTREERLEKIEMCQNAYRAWLENKNREVRERRHHQRNVKSASTKEPQESAIAFKQWLEQKQIQRRKEREIQIKREKEEAELAQRVDPSIANQAYRRYKSS